MFPIKTVIDAILVVSAGKGISVCNLKLQKLLYYCQGYNLAINGNSLFDEEIRAWEHGPVVRSTYFDYNQYGSSPIPTPALSITEFNSEVIKIVEYVVNRLGSIRPWDLRNQTHEEQPWRAHYDVETDSVDKEIISKAEISDYFKQQFASNQDKRLASILDNMNSEAQPIPSGLQSTQDYLNWMDSL